MVNQPLKNKFIFIVEDNPQNRTIYQIALVKAGGRAEFDRSGRDTVTLMKRCKKIDLIILDLMLPRGYTGFEIFEQIREEDIFKDIPIVAISAGDPSLTVPKAKEMGFSGFIAKPINTDIFAQQLSQILEGEEIWFADTRF